MKKLLLLLPFCVISLSTLGDSSADAARTNAKLGLAYLAKGYYQQSKERLLSALHDNSNIASSWYSMAYYLEKTGDTKAADEYYKKALSVEPHSGEAKNNYGTYLCRIHRYEDALRYFDAAAKEPSYLDAASAYQNAGTCALMIPDTKLAKMYFHTALNNNPNMSFSLLSLARLSHQSGDNVAADRYFDDFRKIELHNQSPEVIAQYEKYVFGSRQPQAMLPH